MRKRTTLALLVLALLLLGGGAFTMAPQAAAQETAQTYDGTWSGMTAQGRPIGFTIAGNEVTTANVSYSVGGCGATITTFYSSGRPAVVNGAFSLVINSVQVPPGGGIYFITITVQASFTSPTTATGTLRVVGTACGSTETTWTATREGGTQEYTISGTVRDGSGAPLSGAQVTATATQGGQAPVSAQSAANGSYSLSVPAGAYTVTAAKQGYQAGQSLSITVPPARTGADLTLTATPSGYQVSGTVRDSNGAPVAGAEVTAASIQSGLIVAQSAANGAYSLSLPAGFYTISVAKQGYQQGSTITLTVPPARTGVDLVLPAIGGGTGGTSKVYLPAIMKPAPAPSEPQPGYDPERGVTFYLCSSEARTPSEFLSGQPCPNIDLQAFLYAGTALSTRDFAFVLSEDLVGSNYTFDVLLASLGSTTFDVSAILKRGGSEQTLASTRFTATSRTFTPFTATVAGADAAAAYGDQLILRVRSVSGADAALRIVDTRQTFLNIQ